jgi:hypothetical protein
MSFYFDTLFHQTAAAQPSQNLLGAEPAPLQQLSGYQQKLSPVAAVARDSPTKPSIPMTTTTLVAPIRKSRDSAVVVQPQPQKPQRPSRVRKPVQRPVAVLRFDELEEAEEEANAEDLCSQDDDEEDEEEDDENEVFSYITESSGEEVDSEHGGHGGLDALEQMEQQMEARRRQEKQQQQQKKKPVAAPQRSHKRKVEEKKEEQSPQHSSNKKSRKNDDTAADCDRLKKYIAKARLVTDQEKRETAECRALMARATLLIKELRELREQPVVANGIHPALSKEQKMLITNQVSDLVALCLDKC